MSSYIDTTNQGNIDQIFNKRADGKNFENPAALILVGTEAQGGCTPGSINNAVGWDMTVKSTARTEMVSEIKRFEKRKLLVWVTERSRDESSPAEANPAP